jgi:hypothetical protein
LLAAQACLQHAERFLACCVVNVFPTAVSEALASTEEGWKQLQQHVVAELTMRELDMQVGGSTAQASAPQACFKIPFSGESIHL